MTARATIEQTILQVGSELGKTVPPLTDDLYLVDSGLDSLGMAVVVARLEDSFGVDAFSTAPDGSFPVTVGDLITLYDHAIALSHNAAA